MANGKPLSCVYEMFLRFVFKFFCNNCLVLSVFFIQNSPIGFSESSFEPGGVKLVFKFVEICVCPEGRCSPRLRFHDVSVDGEKQFV